MTVTDSQFNMDK